MTHMRGDFLFDTDRSHTRFLDAGNNETLRTLSAPASKKRQGTKSRAVREKRSSERYGDLMLAPSWIVLER